MKGAKANANAKATCDWLPRPRTANTGILLSLVNQNWKNLHVAFKVVNSHLIFLNYGSLLM